MTPCCKEQIQLQRLTLCVPGADTSKEELNGRVRGSHALPEKQSQANLGRSSAPFHGISPGRPVLKRFSLPSWAWRRGSYLGLLLRRNWEMSPNTKSHSRVNSGQCRAGVCPIRDHTSQALGRFVSHSICFWSLFVVLQQGENDVSRLGWLGCMEPSIKQWHWSLCLELVWLLHLLIPKFTKHTVVLILLKNTVYDITHILKSLHSSKPAGWELHSAGWDLGLAIIWPKLSYLLCLLVSFVHPNRLISPPFLLEVQLFNLPFSLFQVFNLPKVSFLPWPPCGVFQLSPGT